MDNQVKMPPPETPEPPVVPPAPPTDVSAPAPASVTPSMLEPSVTPAAAVVDGKQMASEQSMIRKPIFIPVFFVICFVLLCGLAFLAYSHSN